MEQRLEPRRPRRRKLETHAGPAASSRPQFRLRRGDGTACPPPGHGAPGPPPPPGGPPAAQLPAGSLGHAAPREAAPGGGGVRSPQAAGRQLSHVRAEHGVPPARAPRPARPPATHGSRPRRCCPSSRRPRRISTPRGCSARSGTGTGPPRTPWPALRGRRGVRRAADPAVPAGGRGSCGEGKGALRQPRGPRAPSLWTEGRSGPGMAGSSVARRGRAHAAGVKQLRRTPSVQAHSPAPSAHRQGSTRRRLLQGPPKHARTHALGAAGTCPSCSAACRGPRKRIVRRGSRPAPLTAATERGVSTTRILQLTPNHQ